MEIGKESTKTVEDREEAGTLIHVRDETGEKQYHQQGEEKKPVTLRVCGSYSRTYKRARETQREGNMKRGRAVRDPEVLDQQELRVHAACIKPEDFGPFTVDGKPFEYSPKNAVLVLEAASWIREQVEEAVYDHQGFLNARSIG
jgi:hypothetical protein